jgi:hypothetical protein
MRFLDVTFLKAGLIGLMLLTRLLTAQTNSTNDGINEFYNTTWQIAWGDAGKIYCNQLGHLCIENEPVGTARLLMWSYFFGGHPMNNRFHDLMLDLEIQIEDARVEWHMEREKNKRKNKMILGFTAGGLVLGAVSGFVLGIAVSK